MFALPLADDADLRPLEIWHAEEFAAHVAQARDHLAPWIPFASRVTDADSARELIQRFGTEQARDAGRLYGIWQAGQLVGGTLFKVFDVGQGVCEIGVWLAPQAQGQGLITRAARHMIDWAVQVRGMSRVEWRTDADNAPSKAVAQRLGMHLDGVLRSSFVIRGERRDLEIWSLLADEWTTGSPLTTPTPRG
ncbi:MAG TPA: GNAT family protein [Micromonosporaceae bacterium]